MAADAQWSAVVVNHDAGGHLERCVRSILADGSAGAVEIVVVDNASTDGSAEQLRELALAGVEVVDAPGNVGYARAANLGIAVARTPIVAVLNPDTEVRPGTAGAMVERLRGEPRLGAIGPRVLNVDGTDFPSARTEPGFAAAAGHAFLGMVAPTNRFTRRYQQLDADPNEARSVDWVSGCAVWLRREVLDQIGGWDEQYFMYMEDVDLCRRVRRGGFEVAYEPAGAVVHAQGASTSQRPYRMIIEHHRSLYRFVRGDLVGVRRAARPLLAIAIGVRCGLALARHALGRLREPGLDGPNN